MIKTQRDDNEAAMVKDLRSRGFLVQQLQQGGGVPDLIISDGQRLILCEVKDPAKPPRDRRLTPAQEKWHAAWAGSPVFVVETVDDVLAAFDRARRFAPLRSL